MRSLLQRLGRATDRALSVVIWLHDSVMLFIFLFWLLPLIVLVVISAFIFDLSTPLSIDERAHNPKADAFRAGARSAAIGGAQACRTVVLAPSHDMLGAVAGHSRTTISRQAV